jgi:anthranilate synthase component 1
MYSFKVNIQEQLADLHSPVGIYLQLRDRFSNLLLLESSDYHSHINSYSFICAEPLASIQLQNGNLRTEIEGLTIAENRIEKGQKVSGYLSTFSQLFDFDQEVAYNGLYGHTNFDAVQYFDSPAFDEEKRTVDLPDLRYSLYRFVIAIHHYSNKMYLLENVPEGAEARIGEIEAALRRPASSSYGFECIGEESSPISDQDYLKMIEKAKGHCARGDVFQLVLSRRFSQSFLGDEFNVYRALRSINPSPYLFYFDYGNYKIFGSSPEAQLVIREETAILTPIAGTYKRTGDDVLDQQKALELLEDPKENAEHVMLVDLARNDLNRHCSNVQVKDYKEIQYYSHVIHLVSKVEGTIDKTTNPYSVFADSFPAGTLSGAPKYKALELIDRYEAHNRSFYGGAIGFFSFKGELNQAILIRSFLSHQQALHYQAGAGVVIDSQPEKELQEVHNKLAALKKALTMAEELSFNRRDSTITKH